MKDITILQPWASLIACGAKQIEGHVHGRQVIGGPLAIHAAKSIPSMDLFTRKIEKALWNESTPFGNAIADLVDCLKVVGRVSLTLGV